MPQSMPHSQPDVIFVAGMSGAGRSTVLKIFEDLGYSAIDNLPLSLVEGLLCTVDVNQLPLPMVVGIEFHSLHLDVEKFKNIVHQSRQSLSIRVIFLQCRDEILLRRYTTSRRRHPLGGKSVISSIQEERERLNPLLTFSDHIIDTSETSIVMLGRIIKNIFSLRSSPELQIRVLSFSYRHGLPQDADIVMDARFLQNPYYEASLQYLTGRDQEVADFIVKDGNWEKVFFAMKEMLVPIVNGVRKSGRSYLTIAIGCTGGRHRSVFTAEQLASYLKGYGEKVAIEHRELALGGDT